MLPHKNGRRRFSTPKPATPIFHFPNYFLQNLPIPSQKALRSLIIRSKHLLRRALLDDESVCHEDHAVGDIFRKRISWVTITIAMCRSANDLITFNTSPVSSGSSAEVGSSKTESSDSVPMHGRSPHAGTDRRRAGTDNSPPYPPDPFFSEARAPLYKPSPCRASAHGSARL